MDYPIRILNQLSPILKSFRKARKLTQAELAHQLGVSQQNYAKLEAHPETASLERLFKVCCLLGIEIRLHDVKVSHEPSSKVSSDEW